MGKQFPAFLRDGLDLRVGERAEDRAVGLGHQRERLVELEDARRLGREKDDAAVGVADVDLLPVGEEVRGDEVVGEKARAARGEVAVEPLHERRVGGDLREDGDSVVRRRGEEDLAADLGGGGGGERGVEAKDAVRLRGREEAVRPLRGERERARADSGGGGGARAEVDAPERAAAVVDEERASAGEEERRAEGEGRAGARCPARAPERGPLREVGLGERAEGPVAEAPLHRGGRAVASSRGEVVLRGFVPRERTSRLLLQNRGEGRRVAFVPPLLREVDPAVAVGFVDHGDVVLAEDGQPFPHQLVRFGDAHLRVVVRIQREF